MSQVSVTIEIETDADSLWKIAGDFGGLDRWLPGIETIRSTGDGVGAVRTFSKLQKEMQERQEERIDAHRTYVYSIIAGPLPVANYRGRISVAEISESRSSATWSSTYEVADSESDKWEHIFRKVYRAGLESLRNVAENIRGDPRPGTAKP
jgi:hypothetical protein